MSVGNTGSSSTQAVSLVRVYVFDFDEFFPIKSISIFSNYHEDNEALINRQINLEFYASYQYTAMAHYFGRPDVAFKGKLEKKNFLYQI